MTEQLMHTEINCTTGEVTTRPLTDEELADMEAMAKAQAERQEAELLAKEAEEIAFASANAKLTALGLSTEEIAALTGKSLPTAAK